MLSSHLDIIRQHCRRLEPMGTPLAAALRRQSGIRALLFDVYGTLFISASGEVAAQQLSAHVIQDALASEGLEPASGAAAVDLSRAAADCLAATILAMHATARGGGADYPEVDMIAVWRQTLEALVARQLLSADPQHVDYTRLALQYEVRANPTWPMPGAQECLQAFADRQALLGIVSNAQFFTQWLFPAHFDRTADELGFHRRLQFYSYRHQRAKPGSLLFELARDELTRQGVSACDVLYIGNDMLNDMAPAAGVGFRTALFAGDARSLRQREGDVRVRGLQPDLVVTDLRQLIDVVALAP